MIKPAGFNIHVIGITQFCLHQNWWDKLVGAWIEDKSNQIAVCGANHGLPTVPGPLRPTSQCQNSLALATELEKLLVPAEQPRMQVNLTKRQFLPLNRLPRQEPYASVVGDSAP